MKTLNCLKKHYCLGLICLLLFTQSVHAADNYILGPDSYPQDGVPKGKLTKYKWETSKVFAGTTRDYWVYVPAQYKKGTAACVMVFQDGWAYCNPNGPARVTNVFDNLIHSEEMPVTIGVFINPGVFPSKKLSQKPRRNRSFEYDTLSGDYASFVIDEILPHLAKTYTLTNNPDGRAISGASSGGICAWTVAWQRPDYFRKVSSHIGSFTNIRGGHVYPALIRKTDNKPIRVHLQEGSNDIDNAHGNWPLSNLQMEAALKYKDYDYKFVMGDGSHNRKHSGTIFPDEMRWLWRDWKEQLK